MNREDAIERLCRLVQKVGEQEFNSEYPHDCFCRTANKRTNPEISSVIIEFIEDLVYDALANK